ncbi:MAG: MFS transporter [Acidobacteriota bacterium]
MPLLFGGHAISASSQTASRAVLLPSLLLTVAMFNVTLIVAGLKELVLDDLGGTGRDASLFFSIEALANILFAPLWGVLSDRLGMRRPLVSLGFFGSGVLYLSYLAVDTIPALLAVRFVQGAFSVMGWSLLMSIVLDQPDRRRRGRYMGVMGGALIFGISLGAPVGGWVTSSLGVRAPLWLAGVLFLGLSVAAWLLPAATTTRRRESWRDLVGVVGREPRLLIPYLFQFVDRYSVGFFVVLFPQYLATLGVDDPALRGRYLALYLLPFAILQYFTGRLSDRVGPYPPLIAGSLAYGLVMCLVGFSGLQALWWVMIGLGVLAALMFPPAISLTAELSDERTRGVAMGGFNLAGSLGFAVGPLVGQWAFARGGFGFAFVLSGALEIVIALAAVAFWLRWRGR